MISSYLNFLFPFILYNQQIACIIKKLFSVIKRSLIQVIYINIYSFRILRIPLQVLFKWDIFSRNDTAPSWYSISKGVKSSKSLTRGFFLHSSSLISRSNFKISSSEGRSILLSKKSQRLWKLTPSYNARFMSQQIWSQGENQKLYSNRGACS